MTAGDQAVSIVHPGRDVFALVLDETSFGKATTDPRGFQNSRAALRDAKLRLSGYAVAALCINDK